MFTWHIPLVAKAASCLTSQCSDSCPFRVCRATWRARKSCPISLFIHLKLVLGGSDKLVNTLQIFFSACHPPTALVLRHSITSLTAPEMRYWRFTIDKKSNSNKLHIHFASCREREIQLRWNTLEIIPESQMISLLVWKPKNDWRLMTVYSSLAVLWFV